MLTKQRDREAVGQGDGREFEDEVFYEEGLEDLQCGRGGA